MPCCRLFKHSKSDSLPNAQPAARANMKEGKLNLLEGKLDSFPITSCPPSSSTILPPTETSSLPFQSWTEVQHSEPTDGHPSSLKASKRLPSDLQFRPTQGTNYALSFARAVLEGYRKNIFLGTSQKDRLYAERVVQGEGGDLVFSPSYIASNTLWNGKDSQLRRAAFVHVLGVSAMECTADGCSHAGKNCVACEEGEGMFEGCKHSHDISKKGRCANCEALGKTSACGIRRKDSKDHLSSTSISTALPERPHSKDHLSSTSISTALPERPYTSSQSIGPVLNDFFVQRNEPSDFDVWMAMRKRAIDYEPGVLAMECRLARLWSSVLEDEVGKQKAAGCLV